MDTCRLDQPASLIRALILPILHFRLFAYRGLPRHRLNSYRNGCHQSPTVGSMDKEQKVLNPCWSGSGWEPGTCRWLVTRHGSGPVIRALERYTDPLFRQAGLSLD
jgi:hypothetical protein